VLSRAEHTDDNTTTTTVRSSTKYAHTTSSHNKQ
jgi:hypothetical protein